MAAPAASAPAAAPSGPLGRRAVAAGEWRQRRQRRAATMPCGATTGQQQQQQQQQQMFAAVTAARGFLPERDPGGDALATVQGAAAVPHIPALAAHERCLAAVPDLAMGAPGVLRRALLELPPLDLGAFAGGAVLEVGEAVAGGDERRLPPAGDCYAAPLELSDGPAGNDAATWRAYSVLSFLAHAFLWCDAGGGGGGGSETPQVLPAALARPWALVARALHMPPVLCYCSYNLSNWRRLDAARPVELGNLACLNNFLHGLDEQWFRAVHVAIEQELGPAVAALPALQEAAARDDARALEEGLLRAAEALRASQRIFARITERCAPATYYQRVRLPMSGWRGNDALPRGLVYEGLWGGRPQQLYGETGAQSGLVAALDLALGVEHGSDNGTGGSGSGSGGGGSSGSSGSSSSAWLRQYLLDMRAHMPPAHRRFLAQLEPRRADVRAAVARLAPSSSSGLIRGGGGAVAEAYDAALCELERFRAQHRAFAKSYIADFSGSSGGGSRSSSGGTQQQQQQQQPERGTGGSDFMPALAAYREATAAARRLP